MKISLIIPIFNGLIYYESFKKNILDLYLNNKFEIIVIDDGSNDGFTDLLKAQFPLINVYYQHNQGSGVARNLGIKVSTGDWLMFLDVDDEINIPELNKALSLLEKSVDVFCFQAKRVIHSATAVVEKKWKPDVFKFVFSGYCCERPEIIIDSIVMNKVFKKDYLIHSGVTFPDGKYEDKMFLTNLFLKNPLISINDISFYRWNVYPNSGSQTNTKDIDDISQRFHVCSSQLFLTKNTPFYEVILSNVFNHDITLYSKVYHLKEIGFQMALYQWFVYFKGFGVPNNLSEKAQLIYQARTFVDFNFSMKKISEKKFLDKLRVIFKRKVCIKFNMGH